MNYQPQNMLVTGGAGFIGSHFIRYMLANNANLQIINLDALTYAGSLDNVSDLPSSKHHFIEEDICNTEYMQALFQEHQIDTVVHFAAESHVDRSIMGPGAFVFTNVVGTFNLLEAARLHWGDHADPKKHRFHYISTDEVFGALTKTEKPFTENSPHQPNSPYAASKAAGDHLVRCYHHTYGMPTTISHCSNNYGPMQHPEKFIPTIIRACLAWNPIPIYGKGDQIRDWLYVEDHCEAIECVLKKGRVGDSYNIGGNNEKTNIEIAKHICKIFDDLLPREKPYETLITSIIDRPGHDWRYAINSSKIKKELGWEAKEQFESGILKTVKRYLAAR